MSNTKTKTISVNHKQDEQLSLVLSYSDPFLQSQTARGICYMLDSQIDWLNKQLADAVAELDEMTEVQKTGIERMAQMRVEKNIERTKDQLEELNQDLQTAMEIFAQVTTKAPYQRRSK